jgi:hypothetical protein
MVNYMDAIKKPFSDLKTLGIGGVLGAIPIVNLLVNGYGLKTAEDVMAKKNALRKWAVNDLVEYLLKAIIMLVIGFVYTIIPVILILVGVGGAIVTAIMSAQGATGADAIGQLIVNSLMTGAPFIILGVILLIIALIMLPMAILKWIKSKSIAKAFNVIEVAKNVLTVDYIVSLIVLFVYSIILAIIVGVISMIVGLIPVVGFLLILYLQGLMTFAMQVTTYTTLAQTVK